MYARLFFNQRQNRSRRVAGIVLTAVVGLALSSSTVVAENGTVEASLKTGIAEGEAYIQKLQGELIELLSGEQTDETARSIARKRAEVVETRAALEDLQSQLAKVDSERAKLAERTRQQEVAKLQEAVANRDEQLRALNEQLAVFERERETPLENAELKIYQLKYLPAEDASFTIREILGDKGLRISVDERSNALVVSAQEQKLQLIEALLARLDSSTESDLAARGASHNVPRSLLVRVIWLADDLLEGEGEPPANYLPIPVIEALGKLGVNAGRVVGQAIASVSRDGDARHVVDFRSKADAVIRNQPVFLSCQGRVHPLVENLASLDVDINVSSPTINTAVEGSISTPLGQYMVLGTANAVTSEQTAAGRRATLERLRAQQEAERAMEEERMREEQEGDRPYRPRGGSGGGFGGRTPLGHLAGAEEAPTHRSTRFVFVIQVLRAESFAQETQQ
jgi:hypothetical protein